jgi:hypothetical protein
MDWLKHRLEWPDGVFKGTLLDLLFESQVQAILRRRFNPSGQLEARRYPKLRPVKANPRLTVDYLEPTWGLEKAVNRLIGQILSDKFITHGGILGGIKVYPPEATAAQLKKRKAAEPKKTGRRTKYHRPMTPAERQRKKRGKAVFLARKYSGGILPDNPPPAPEPLPEPWGPWSFWAPPKAGFPWQRLGFK